jgi:ligand-binding sensor domain-containing protein
LDLPEATMTLLALYSSLSMVTDLRVDSVGDGWVSTTGGTMLVSPEGEVVAVDRLHGALGPAVEADPRATLRTNATERQVVRDGDGRRVAAVPAAVVWAARLSGGDLVGTIEGTFWVSETGMRRVDPEGICGNFITGIARFRGDLVVGTFDRGACVLRDGRWQSLPSPSPMVNDVLVTGPQDGQGPDAEMLWLATAEGLAWNDGDTWGSTGAVPDDSPRHSFHLNSSSVNGLATDGSHLWTADVLGPSRVDLAEDAAFATDRYRWSVSGHSYQAVSVCGKVVVAGSEDDGLAVLGLDLGARNGKSRWRHVNALDGLPEDWVMATACAGKNAAWIGTYRHGVGRLDSMGYHPVAGLETAWVQALATDGPVLWVGTADGVFRVEGGTVTQASSDDAWSLYVEPGRLYVGTRTGLRVYGTRSATLARAAH